MVLRTFVLLTGSLLLGCGQIAFAADSKEGDPKQPAITVAEADADFSLQGEYSGEIEHDGEKVKLGVQVIALGGGKFRAVGYPGGLPGDGWNREKKTQAEAKREGDKVTFKSDKGKGTLQNGLLIIETADGEQVGTLKKVTRKSPTLGRKPPKGAVVLFDGKSPDKFVGGRMTKDGLLMQGVTSKQTFGDVSLHMEFLLSYMPYASEQRRSNSGLYLQGRHEVQILDSFGLEGKHNECGGIYTVKDPDVNMCFPPLSWQTFDVDFTAARFDKDGKKTANARLTVKHNGVVVHDDVEVPKATTGARLKEGPERGPIYIQNHGNPLRFRNIWLVEKQADDEKQATADTDKGWLSLFDGKTLRGWHKNPQKIGHGTGGHWFVEDGEIVGEQDPPGSGNGGILLTDRKFGDFELLIDMKPDWGVCSGLFLRSNERGQCYQMMVDYHDRGNVGHVYGEGTGGFNTRTFDVFGVYEDEKKLVGLTTKPTATTPPAAFSISGADWVKAWKVNDWNTARVRCVGNPPQITTWINGVKVNEFDGRSFEDPKFDRKKLVSLLGDKGRIAVQVHGGTGWPKGAQCRWRNIRIKELSD
jgi:hypothetical protein